VEIKKTDRALLPQPVSDLLQALSNVGFFDESMLIGSWVMPLYKARLTNKHCEHHPDELLLSLFFLTWFERDVYHELITYRAVGLCF
jgi:hypothetical protein